MPYDSGSWDTSRILDLRTIRLDVVLNSTDSALNSCLEQLLTDMSRPDEVYAAHNTTASNTTARK
ncbi:hypothetical protein RB614_10305 [Phytohabitans sp. ZYX-F-186]|uniref:Uncharacterized protein n=1 Tax=Phytohabitans maris TaxID=3071409 RepID=A0ABU0ZG31_9ACTN|nr:hypothetical protein [Phytohabitans sp. ZYX-F-186]MDQ7904912.1 hypothetical protein [Phytohabitans sp. ZYX-F-186]